MSSVSRLAKKLSARALKLLWSSSGMFRHLVSFGVEIGPDLAGDVALQAADNLGLRLAFGGAARDVADRAGGSAAGR